MNATTIDSWLPSVGIDPASSAQNFKDTAACSADAMQTILMALNQTMSNGAVDSAVLWSKMKSTAFMGPDAYVSYDSVGDRNVDISVMNLKATSGAVEVGTWSLSAGLAITKEIVWSGGTTNTPPSSRTVVVGVIVVVVVATIL